MIPNEMLRESAARTYEKYVSNLLSDFDPEYHYEFSSGFEKKIEKLKRRADHPVLYRTMKRIAIIFLTLLIAGAVWISVDDDARAAFFGWISEITGSYYEYHHTSTADNTIEQMDYRPTWIPYGYSEKSVRVFDDKTTVRYLNDGGELLSFSYVNTHEAIDWSFDISKGSMQSCNVGEYSASLFLSDSEDTASFITWVNGYDTAFFITGFISETELMRVAESVSIAN